MFLKKLEIELPYDPRSPLLGVYLGKTTVQKDACIRGDFSGRPVVKNPPCNELDVGLIPGQEDEIPTCHRTTRPACHD